MGELGQKEICIHWSYFDSFWLSSSWCESEHKACQAAPLMIRGSMLLWQWGQCRGYLNWYLQTRIPGCCISLESDEIQWCSLMSAAWHLTTPRVLRIWSVSPLNPLLAAANQRSSRPRDQSEAVLSWALMRRVQCSVTPHISGYLKS